MPLIKYSTFILFIILSDCLNATELIGYSSLPMKAVIKRKLQKGRIIARSKVQTIKPHQQSLDFSIAGIHPKKCQFVLRKLSQYERYDQFLNVIDKSTYNDLTQRLFFHLHSLLLPFDMSLKFKLERISKPGVYHFEFNQGFLKGLKGTIHVSKYRNQCLFYCVAKWKGKETGINSSIFEFFSQALSKLVMENLFRISMTY